MFMCIMEPLMIDGFVVCVGFQQKGSPSWNISCFMFMCIMFPLMIDGFVVCDGFQQEGTPSWNM